MKKSLIISLLNCSCILMVVAQPATSNLDFTMTHEILNLPIEDQGSTGTCWSFSTASFLESEMHKRGADPVDLSEMFFVRKTYVDKATRYLRLHGNSNFSEGSLGHDALRMLDRHGAMPESAYTGLLNGKERHNHAMLFRAMKAYLDRLIEVQRIPADWQDEFCQILDKHLGMLPTEFSYAGQQYTPLSFAKSHVPVSPSDYISITSFSQYPYWKSHILEIPDNYAHQAYINVPIKVLAEVVHYALAEGHSAVWDCDVSEKGFLQKDGLAILYGDGARGDLSSSEDLSMIQEERQRAFDSYDLTDDHLMHIVGSAKDQKNLVYFYVKNSWGIQSGESGYLYASEPYFLRNTIGILVNKAALPPDVRMKIELLNPK